MPRKKEQAEKNRDSYYPFGMNIAALSSSAPMSMANRFKYNGNEEQTNFDFNIYDFNARMYDAQLGRFMNIDPLAETQLSHSPYHFSYNNPIFFNDPTGLNPALDGRYTAGRVDYTSSTRGKTTDEIVNAAWNNTEVGNLNQFSYNSGVLNLEYSSAVSDGFMSLISVISMQDPVYGINTVLGLYKKPFREDILFPKNYKSKMRSVFEIIKGVFDPFMGTGSEAVDVGLGIYVLSDELLSTTNYNSYDDVPRKHLLSYSITLRLVEYEIQTEIDETNKEIAELRSKNGFGYYNPNIERLTKIRWDLENRLAPVLSETKVVDKLLEKSNVRLAGN